MVEANVITEILPGHFHVLLDFPKPSDAALIVDPEVEFVWIIGYEAIGVEWQPYAGQPFDSEGTPLVARARNLKADFLLETERFLKLADRFTHTLHLVQLPEPPPYFLDFDRFKGKLRYKALAEIGNYRMELLIPGASDFAPLVSRDRAVLERAIKLKFK